MNVYKPNPRLINRVEEEIKRLNSLYGEKDQDENPVMIHALTYVNDTIQLMHAIEEMKKNRDEWELKYYRLRNEGLE